MKPIGSRTTTERVNTRQEQEFRTTLKKGGVVGIEKRVEKLKGVLGRIPKCNRETSGRRLVSAGRGHSLSPDKGSVHGPAWLVENPDLLSCDKSFLRSLTEQIRASV
jgi:hypothetical protein